MDRPNIQYFLIIALLLTFSAHTLKASTSLTDLELTRCWNVLETVSGHVMEYEITVESTEKRPEGQTAKILPPFWDSAEEKERPLEPIGYVVLHKNHTLSFRSLTREEKVSILAQLAQRNLNVTLIQMRDSAVRDHIAGLFNQAEPYVRIDSRNIKVAEIKSIRINDAPLVTLSLTKRFSLALVKGSEAQVVSEFSQGDEQAKTLLQDFLTSGADVDLLSYHLDRLGLRGSSLVRAYENVGKDRARFLKDVTAENLTLQNGVATLAPKPFESTLRTTEGDYTTIEYRIPVRVKEAKTEELKALFNDAQKMGVIVKVEFWEQDQAHLVTGKILQLNMNSGHPSVLIEGNTRPISLNQMSTFVSQGENNFLVSFTEGNLRAADMAFGYRVKKDNVVKFEAKK